MCVYYYVNKQKIMSKYESFAYLFDKNDKKVYCNKKWENLLC